MRKCYVVKKNKQCHDIFLFSCICAEGLPWNAGQASVKGSLFSCCFTQLLNRRACCKCRTWAVPQSHCYNLPRLHPGAEPPNPAEQVPRACPAGGDITEADGQWQGPVSARHPRWICFDHEPPKEDEKALKLRWENAMYHYYELETL